MCRAASRPRCANQQKRCALHNVFADSHIWVMQICKIVVQRTTILQICTIRSDCIGRFVVCHAFPYARPTAYRRPGRRPAPAGACPRARKKEPRAARLLPLLSYSMISVTTPEPTVLPPSLMANLSPSSIAIGVIRSISIVMLSPGMHISTPSGSFRSPVTSVVLK